MQRGSSRRPSAPQTSCAFTTETDCGSHKACYWDEDDSECNVNYDQLKKEAGGTAGSSSEPSSGSQEDGGSDSSSSAPPPQTTAVSEGEEAGTWESKWSDTSKLAHGKQLIGGTLHCDPYRVHFLYFGGGTVDFAGTWLHAATRRGGAGPTSTF